MVNFKDNLKTAKQIFLLLFRDRKKINIKPQVSHSAYHQLKSKYTIKNLFYGLSILTFQFQDWFSSLFYLQSGWETKKVQLNQLLTWNTTYRALKTTFTFTSPTQTNAKYFC